VGSGNFLTALETMAQWMGNLILPTLSAFCVIAAILAYGERRDGQRHIVGAILCLMGPGCALLINYFTTSAAPTTVSSTQVDSFTSSLMNGASYIGNVLMPLIAVLFIIRGALTLGGFMERFNIGDDWVRYFMIAAACFMVSGIVRLLEYLVTNATTLSPGTGATTTSLLLIHIATGGSVWHYA
jgi:hypothetical protein